MLFMAHQLIYLDSWCGWANFFKKGEIYKGKFTSQNFFHRACLAIVNCTAIFEHPLWVWEVVCSKPVCDIPNSRHPDSSVDSEVVSTTSYMYIPLLHEFESHWRQIKIKNPASMYEWLAVTFWVAVVSQSISCPNCRELSWLSSCLCPLMEVKY